MNTQTEPKERLNGAWPTGTWFQKRLMELRIAEAVKPYGKDLLDVLNKDKGDK